MLEQLVDNVYTRMIIAFILSLVLAFSDQMIVLRHPMMLVTIGALTLTLVAFDVVKDLGITMLMCCMFVVVYNLQTFRR